MAMRTFALRALIVAAVLATSGCSIGSPVPDPVTDSCLDFADCGASTDFDGMLADWERTAETLEVPLDAAMRPPTLEDFGGGEQEFSAGYGRSIAHSQWFCLWEGEFLAHPDPARPEGGAALEQLRLFLRTDTFAEDYAGDVGIVAMIEDAEEGDLTRLAQDHEVNCSG